LRTHAIQGWTGQRQECIGQAFVKQLSITASGILHIRAYRDRRTGADHLALFWRPPPRRGALVRVHSECLTGEAFGSTKCECIPQLALALRRIAREGGVVVYINKLRAYDLQARGRDTVEANEELGLPVDARDYAAACDILSDLGVQSCRLLTNNHEKAAALRERGFDVEQLPHNAGACSDNQPYRHTKRVKMGHTIADGPVEEVFG
jgi:3,4-dihydroxy 2-butanone 4-phosphate synthase/GTP cyclohydrolase II